MLPCPASLLSSYILAALAALAGIFLLGLFLGLGIYAGYGVLEARSDRKRDRQWQHWQEEQTYPTNPPDKKYPST